MEWFVNQWINVLARVVIVFMAKKIIFCYE